VTLLLFVSLIVNVILWVMERGANRRATEAETRAAGLYLALQVAMGHRRWPENPKWTVRELSPEENARHSEQRLRCIEGERR
jgi:hypothetical protein